MSTNTIQVSDIIAAGSVNSMDHLPMKEVRTRDLKVGDIIAEGNKTLGWNYAVVTDIKVERNYKGTKKWRVFFTFARVGISFGATNRVWVVAQ